ncbi:MAG TPA: hypothetical protein VHA11_07745 [Bryobacteraceae bacterium]|nr:hypothetical protein [Bryobacteraceae bacterium]
MSQPAIMLTSLDAARVYLLPSTAPAFTEALDAERDSALDVILPFAVLISNDSAQEIIAYSIRWICTDTNGNIVVPEVTHFEFSSFHSAANLLPHGSRIVSNISGLGSRGLRWETVREDAVQLVDLFRRQHSIVISLEAVVFEDGGATGPDRNHWIPQWKAYIDGDRDVYGAVSRNAPGLRGLLSGFAELGFERARPMFKDEHRDVDHLQLAANRAATYEECYVLIRVLFAAGLLERMDRQGEDKVIDAARDFTRSRKFPNIHRKEF